MGILQKILAGKTLTNKDRDGIIATNENLAIINSPSFTDLLPVRQFAKDGIFYFRDLKNTGAMFKFAPIVLDNKNDEEKEELLNEINFAIKSTIPDEYSELWHSQVFVKKSLITKSLLQNIENYSAKTTFSKHWYEVLTEHLESVSNPNGAFVDKNTGLNWSVSGIEITMCLWQELSLSNTNTLQERLDKTMEVVERVQSALEQINIQLSLCNEQDYINHISNIFHDKKVDYKPHKFSHFEDDLTQLALNNTHISVKDSAFKFQNKDYTKYSVFLPLEKLSENIKLGHTTGEQKDKTTILDKLPMNSTFVQTVVYMHSDKITEELTQIANRSIGIDTELTNNKEKANVAIETLRSGENSNVIYRYSAGIYLHTDKKESMDKLMRDVISIFGNKGLELLELNLNPTAQHDFIQNLPFAFSYTEDRKYYNKKSVLQDLETINKLLPWCGRSTGTGSAGLIKFNRGGEPLLFDPVVDKSSNAFGLLFGPSGSGKSSFLIEHMFDMIRAHDPKAVFILEKGNSFGLAVEHLSQFDLTTNKISITPTGENITLPPFADAPQTLKVAKKGEKLDARDVLEELSMTAQLMITAGNQTDIDAFRTKDFDVIARAIKLAAQNSLAKNRTTLTEDVANAFYELAKEKDLEKEERLRIKEMGQSIKAFISSAFGNAVFNTEGELLPEVDITQIDVGYLGNPNQESKLLVAFMALMSEINRLAETNQFSGKPIFLYIDEAHLFTKHTVIIKYLMTMIKMWRKWNVWVWLATPSLEDYTKEASSMFGTIEWIVVLQANKKEIDKLATLITLTEQQKVMLNSMRGANKQYKEGMVISPNITSLFRSVSTSLSLALAMTEPDEKAMRQKIMQQNNCTELEAAYQIAQDITKARKGASV